MAQDNGIVVKDIQFNMDPSHKGLDVAMRVQVLVSHFEHIAADLLGKSVAEALHDKVRDEIAKNLPDIIAKVGSEVAVAGIKSIVHGK